MLKQPQGYAEGGGKKPCLLHRALHGLRQSPGTWHKRLMAEPLSLGFATSDADPGLLFPCKENKKVYIILYVDGMLIAADSLGDLQRVKAAIVSRFDAHDFGKAQYFLGVGHWSEIQRQSL